ncbi:MAG: preprotein translocase subunit SecG [Acholeplasmataceae bacterium]|jgi:preprotein translocase subunit SecG|nr:preprotein translocase subunit SecG [Acholeplasmataceae bacterium]
MFLIVPNVTFVVKYLGTNCRGGIIVYETILMVLEVLVCLALIASVLLQSGKSSGLSGSIGGGGETFFGGKSSDMDAMLAKATIVLGILFGIITLLIARVS